MKKLFLALTLVAATCLCQAQVYLGGSIGYGMTNGKVSATVDKVTETLDLPNTSNFSFVPTVGYMFNESFGFGLDFGVGIGNYKYNYSYDDYEFSLKETETSWTVAPYFRWVFGKFDRVKLYADAKINFGGSSIKTSYTEDKTTTNTDGDKASEFGINIVPGVKFMLNDHISINGKLNLLSLGYNMTTIKTKDVDNYLDGYYYKSDDEIEYTIKNNEFGIGVNYKTALEVGLIYTF